MADGGFTICEVGDDNETKRPLQRQHVIETLLGAGISFGRDTDGKAMYWLGARVARPKTLRDEGRPSVIMPGQIVRGWLADAACS